MEHYIDNDSPSMEDVERYTDIGSSSMEDLARHYDFDASSMEDMEAMEDMECFARVLGNLSTANSKSRCTI